MSKMVTVDVPVRAYDETLRFVNKVRRAGGRRPLKKIPGGTISTSDHPLARAAGVGVFGERMNKHSRIVDDLVCEAGKCGTPVRLRRGTR